MCRTHCTAFTLPDIIFLFMNPRPGFHRVMTSLSKIYSRAKAANKGKAGTALTTSLSGSTAVETTALLPAVENKKNLKNSTSIFQPTPSEDVRTRVGVVVSDALASLTGKSVNNNMNKNGGVASIYFGNRSQAADQYLTVKPKLPSRVSSDPIRVFKQTDEEEQKGKTWSNDVLPKALKSWPATSDKSSVSGTSTAGESEKSVRLYDFSSTPTGVSTSSGDSVGKRSPPKSTRHVGGLESPPLGSSVGSVKSVNSVLGGGNTTSPGSGGGGGVGVGGGGGRQRTTAAGQINESQSGDKHPLGGLFQVPHTPHIPTHNITSPHTTQHHCHPFLLHSAIFESVTLVYYTVHKVFTLKKTLYIGFIVNFLKSLISTFYLFYIFYSQNHSIFHSSGCR